MVNPNNFGSSENGYGWNANGTQRDETDLDGMDYAEASLRRQEEEMARLAAEEEAEDLGLLNDDGDNFDIQSQNIEAANNAQEEDAADEANEG